MKVLVYAHRLQIGGTQVNSIELAAHMQDHFGYEIVFCAQPGPMEELVEAKGLKYTPAPDATVHPSIGRMKTLREIAHDQSPDLIHAWDWWQGLDAYLALYLPSRVPLIITDMMMEVTKVLPKRLTTTFGTPLVTQAARDSGWNDATLLLPPVDVEINSPTAVDSSLFREKYVDPDALTVVTVARLSASMKLDGLVRSIYSVEKLDGNVKLQLIIVGDGTERRKLEELARQTNERLQRDAVVLAGSIVDPRPAYAAADIVIGMGGSALRGMAFGKPVIVVGERGFAKTFLPENADAFLYTGMYGVGQGSTSDCKITAALSALTEEDFDREALGVFSRKFVVQNHSLDAVGSVLNDVYQSAWARRLNRAGTALDTARTTYLYFRERRFRWPSRDPLKTLKSTEAPQSVGSP
ncbi:Glycosyltransferase involved in cell wall bisynthesis [Jannaschia faecimaris]|uniref:Glycosyltransferase involved in cell wall bisynthesis n=1 Tax=Jannaschia faecimaris TaxID=1244108 RepID=A0A1H3UCL6_9RHOB|nr:glycosyltransferase family 4 protein [Jannaschia faecimaris]SDZ60118.1 Glycosyltransferase involved in cell wall bisynthesis [Jannaschia faecimaris]